MTYYIQTRDGKIYKGKNRSGSWKEVERSLPLGANLYDPYSKRTVIGWELYKSVLARGQAKLPESRSGGRKEDFSKERAWINKKLSSGVSEKDLLHSVGSFSNKKKERVMKEKNITDKQYRERYDFLAKVYYLLSGGKS